MFHLIFVICHMSRVLLIHCLGWKKTHSVILNNFIDKLLFSKLWRKVTQVYLCFLNLLQKKSIWKQLFFKQKVLLKIELGKKV